MICAMCHLCASFVCDRPTVIILLQYLSRSDNISLRNTGTTNFF